MKHFKILFNAGEGGEGGSGGGSGADGGQAGEGGGSNGEGGDQPIKGTLEERINYLEGQLGTAINERDTARKKVKEFEDNITKQNGQFEKLANDRQAEIDRLSTELQTAKAGSDEWEKYKKNKRKSLTEELPEEKRVFTEGMTLELLEKFVKENTNGTPGVDAGKSGEGVTIIQGKKWDDYTTAELDKIAETSPETHKQLYKEKFK